MSDTPYKVFYFSAPWCPPCQTFGPIVQEVSKDFPDIDVIKLNIDEEEGQELGFKYGIHSIPTLVSEHAHDLQGAVTDNVLRAWFNHVRATEGAINGLNA